MSPVFRLCIIYPSVFSLLSFIHADKPNIVLILVDVVCADVFSCYGHKVAL